MVIPSEVDLGEWSLDNCGWLDSDIGTPSQVEAVLLRQTPKCLFFLNGRYIMNPDDYIEIRLLGRGPAAKVFLCEHKGSGVLVALRKIHGRGDRFNQLLFIHEIAIRVKLDLPGIAKLIGFRFPEPKTGAPGLIMTELMPNGTLEALLKSKHTGRPTPGFGPTEQSKAVFGIASTMAQIHKRSVIHRDLKPSHVLFDANWEIRIGGFGMSRTISIKMTMAIGIPMFMAPELGDGDGEYSFPVDVYAFGVLLYRFFTDQHLLEGMERQPISPNGLMIAVVVGKRYKRPIGVPDPFWNLITRCWAQDPAHRPTFEEIVKLMLESQDFTFPGTDVEKYNEYRQRMTSGQPRRVQPSINK
jgi:serine/threonine protein kinase